MKKKKELDSLFNQKVSFDHIEDLMNRIANLRDSEGYQAMFSEKIKGFFIQMHQICLDPMSKF